MMWHQLLYGHMTRDASAATAKTNARHVNDLYSVALEPGRDHLKHCWPPVQHRPHRSLHGAAPLKPLPEPAGLDLYRIREQAHVGGMINEYRPVA